MNPEKRCTRCKTIQPTTNFHSNKARIDGLQSNCKDCVRAASKTHYENHKQEYFSRNQEVRRRQKLRLLEVKRNTPCTDCGQIFHPFIMEFDHQNPDNKLFSIGRRGGKANKQLNEELAKCDLVCANCHKLRTFRRNQKRPGHVLTGVE